MCSLSSTKRPPGDLLSGGPLPSPGRTPFPRRLFLPSCEKSHSDKAEKLLLTRPSGCEPNTDFQSISSVWRQQTTPGPTLLDETESAFATRSCGLQTWCRTGRSICGALLAGGQGKPAPGMVTKSSFPVPKPCVWTGQHRDGPRM